MSAQDHGEYMALKAGETPRAPCECCKRVLSVDDLNWCAGDLLCEECVKDKECQ